MHPTTSELQAFGAVFSRTEWRTLCQSREFTDRLMSEGPKAVAALTAGILNQRRGKNAKS